MGKIADLEYDIPIDIKYAPYIETVGQIKFTKVYPYWKNLKGFHLVYMLLEDDKLIYIGVTSDLHTRMLSHASHKKFNKIVLIECTERKFTFKIEKHLIRKYQPILNCKSK
jgi:hypothetical protein